ncbi:transmembrane protein, putative (macronuclear) [Tetrahymena thermophila SB210]|uniref:transmembrane protein, putative n=1 Tax=Tetrahymena thermophila (strain SB210) TaxID=312017 RepID=UPI0003F3B935|nr:transmembrane protein, putative [Tetrahymena thermophila SB210]EAS03145.3 transmembrane protein, putative [Tetrahymena thermophila SB210]|eukprot:XP_001023391.3 transmembrane protein, putative [Tetrahymena thermophila SB210]
MVPLSSFSFLTTAPPLESPKLNTTLLWLKSPSTTSLVPTSNLVLLVVNITDVPPWLFSMLVILISSRLNDLFSFIQISYIQWNIILLTCINIYNIYSLYYLNIIFIVKQTSQLLFHFIKSYSTSSSHT